MSEYQVLARKYRPQTFGEVVGQDAIVTTLKNAMRMGRLAHAYLFCGSRGTGKTTLARLFAKALNCESRSPEGDPCNQCPSCREISSGCSLDVLEIDGASHRGIDDIRQLNENVGYTTNRGGYKIYIIDEVHMLTKEAFNALLKTLEEPPEKVKFFFATTEPHKVLPTILSRCQRFNLNRIPFEQIVGKLASIARDCKIDCEEEALRMVAKRADGGLRDAESLLDQIFSFHEGSVTAASVSGILGLMPRDILFELDVAASEGRLAKAFDIAHQIFSEGKDIGQFLNSLCEHFRHLLIVKLCGAQAPFLELTDIERHQYAESSKRYSAEQCQHLVDFLIKAQEQIRFQTSGLIALEATLLHILSIHQRISAGQLVQRLAELENAVSTGSVTDSHTTPAPQVTPEPISAPVVQSAPAPIIQVQPVAQVHVPPQAPAPVAVAPMASYTPPPQPAAPAPLPLKIQEDPTPSLADLGHAKKAPVSAPAPVAAMPKPAPAPVSAPTAPRIVLGAEAQRRVDTIMQFTAIELEGRIQKP